MSKKRALELIRKAKQTNATRLNLSKLELTELPPEIGELTNLRVLRLHENKLEVLPPVSVRGPAPHYFFNVLRSEPFRANGMQALDSVQRSSGKSLHRRIRA